MMSITTLFALAFLPASLLASPRLLPLKLQNILETTPAASAADQLKPITVYNANGLDTSILLYHWRGQDKAFEEKLKWEYIAKGDTATGKTAKFDPSTNHSDYETRERESSVLTH
jgi:hypothetical protein